MIRGYFSCRQSKLLIDETHDNYLFAPVGWLPQGRVHGVTLYVRIRNGKF